MTRAFRNAALLLVSTVAAGACAKAPPLMVDVPVAELRTRAAVDSADAIARYNLGIGLWSEGDYESARRELRRAVSLDTRFAEGYLALAFLPYAERPALWGEIARGEVPAELEPALIEADQNYQRALMIDPLVDMKIVAAVEPVERFWQVGGPFKPAYDVWFRGMVDYRNGDYGLAFRRYSDLIRDLERGWRHDARERMPDVILLYRGLAAAHLERWDVAVGDIRILYERERAIEEEDEMIHVPLETNHYRYLLGVLLALSGEHAEAEQLLREATVADLGLYMAHVRLADIAEARGDGRLAIEERQRAINANPDDPSLHIDLGVTLAALGHLPEAVTSIRNGLILSPQYTIGHYMLGVILSTLGDTAGARASFERFLVLAPSRMAYHRQDTAERLTALGAE